MSKIRQTLQLLATGQLSARQIGAALSISKTTVGEIAMFARTVGVDATTAAGLSDEQLRQRLYPPARPRLSGLVAPDFAMVHGELKRPGVTLQLLWEEYREAHGDLAFRYSAFCQKYRAWAKALRRSMRQVHPGGERLFVDYAGQTVAVIDRLTGEVRQAQVFVAVLGASNYTWACATWRQTAEDWVGSIIKALSFIGGVPRLLVPDQPRALIANPDAYEPVTARLMQELTSHYSLPVLPARPGRPKDKAKVEVAVQIVERWILARLRHRRFFALDELNGAISALLVDLNARPFKQLPGCRNSAFVALDRPALAPLPASPMIVAQFKPARVNIDYHVAFEGHYYSVPHAHVGKAVQLRITASTIEILLEGRRIGAHPRSARKGAHSTSAEHMPASHRAHREWTPARLISWAERIGQACAKVVRWQMDNRPHPEQGYRACLGLMRLARQCGNERLEAACARALSLSSPQYRSVKSILAAGLDRHDLNPFEAAEPMPVHDNVRGPGYYGTTH